ncbi:MAG: amino acid ABC transporter substrate-binding protein [Syntrophus sp. (in: bacteria)]|nr:amino acid ABC transporter substrate-binding protein [Syntrophus sp. (in: bacteria)]
MKYLAALTVCICILFLCSASQGAPPIKIGIVDSYSGPATAYSQDVLDGFKLAINAINAKGGVIGRKIEFVTRDDKFKPDIALNAAKELVLSEHVDLLMGTTNSAAALAISDFAKKEKVPFLVTDSKSEKIIGERGHRYVFNFNENTAMIGKAAALVLAKKPYVKYYIAGEDYEFGHACADAVWNNLKIMKPNVQLLGQSWRKVGETDLIPYITSMMQIKPDFIISAAGGSGVVNFLKSSKSTGLNTKIPLYQHNATDTAALLPIGLDGPEGVMGTANYHFHYPNTPENKAFVEEFRKVYNRYPKSTALYGYITGMFMAKAFQKAGNTNRERFIDALEGSTIESPVGKLEMRACDHQVILPMFVGITKKVPGYDFLLASDIITIPGKDYLMSCEEVIKLRK